MSQCLQTTHGCGLAGLCRCSNTTHRLGKYHVPSTVEVPGNMSLLLPLATSYQRAKLDTGSGLSDWLTQCADLHCEAELYLSDGYPLKKCKHNTDATSTMCYKCTERWFTISPSIKTLHLERMNRLHSCFPQSGKKEMTAGAAPFTKERLAALIVCCGREKKGPILPQLYSQSVSDSSDSPSSLSL